MIYGLIGEKLSHSYSPAIHKFFGNNSYILKEIARDDLNAFMEKADFSAINVTIPYKEDVMPYCILSKEAVRISAVNTIVKRDGKLYGYNTDYMGFSLCVKRAGITFLGNKVVILGSGGTCKTAKTVALDEGASEVIIVSRSGENNYENISKHYDAQIIINTSPVGMYPNTDKCPLDITPFTKLVGVIDVIYNPLYTNLLLQAKKRNIPHTGGLSMLVAQGYYAHNLFFGIEKIDETILENSIKQAESFFKNIVLIGMPGAGKSTVGKILAQKYDMKFIDSDEEIEKVTGIHPAKIIVNDGEKRFREIESEIICDIAKKTGYVIATGGGAVILEKNQNALMQNGIIFYLERDIESLACDNRPLSTNLNKLYTDREAIYNALADVKIKVSNNIDETIKSFEEQIWKYL